MHIKPNADEENYDQYLETYKLQELIKKYSDYIRYPIVMEVEDYRQKEKPADAGEDYKPEWETVKEWKSFNQLRNNAATASGFSSTNFSIKILVSDFSFRPISSNSASFVVSNRVSTESSGSISCVGSFLVLRNTTNPSNAKIRTASAICK